mgnify:CR=1 FL=1
MLPTSNRNNVINRKVLVNEYTDHIRQSLNGDPNLVPYFVTISFVDFDVPGKQSLKKKSEYAWQQYDRVYRHLVSKLMKHPFRNRNRKFHPFTVDFFDLPGTRHSMSLNCHEPSTPHIHSIYLVHKSTLGSFDDLRLDSFNKIVNHRSMRGTLVSIHAVPIDVATLKTVVDYASKLLKNYTVRDLSEDVPLYSQFPITKDEQKIRKNSLRHNRLICQGALDCLSDEYLSKSVGNETLSRLVINICASAGSNDERNQGMRKSMYTTTRSFRCSKLLSDEVDRLAKETNRKASDIVREAITGHLPTFGKKEVGQR